MQEMITTYWPNRKNRSNRIESIQFGLVTKSNRFGSVLQKLAKIESMLTPNSSLSTPTACHESQSRSFTLVVTFTQKPPQRPDFSCGSSPFSLHINPIRVWTPNSCFSQARITP